MVACTTCTIQRADRHCTNTPRSCYQCCTSHADILTCPLHFHAMGNTAAAARLLTGLVHPNIKEDGEEGLPPALAPPPPIVVSGEQPVQPGALVAAPPAPPGPLEAAPAPAAAGPPALTLASLASTVVTLSASVVDVAASLAVMRSAVTAIQSSVDAALRLRPPPTAAPIQLTTVAQQHTPQLSAASPAPPHRAAVLDRAAAAPRASAVGPSAGSFGVLAQDGDDEDDEDAHEVRSHAHIPGVQSQPSALLPAAFVPTPSGTAQNAQQQLAALFNGLAKQGSKVKYATISELNEALDDWATDSLAAGWSAAQVESIRAYQRLLTLRFTVSEHWTLKEVLDYHRKWCKAVHAGTIDMFARGAELNLIIEREVKHPIQLGAAAASSTSAAKSGKSKGSAAAAPTTQAAAARPPASNKHPAGSCTNHPASTSHTTAECNKK